MNNDTAYLESLFNNRAAIPDFQAYFDRWESKSETIRRSMNDRFEKVAAEKGVPLEVSPLIMDIFRDGKRRYGGDAWSTGIVRRIEEACGTELRAPGFPAELVDEEPETRGYEVRPQRG